MTSNEQSLVTQQQVSVEERVTNEDALNNYALAELRQELPDIFPPLDPTQTILVETRKLEMLHKRMPTATHNKMSQILARIAHENLWQYHPEGFASLEEYLHVLDINQSLYSQLTNWNKVVFPLIESTGRDPLETFRNNPTNIKLITPHLVQLATGKPSHSTHVRNEVDSLLAQYKGDKIEAVVYLLDQAALHSTRALKQNLLVGEEIDIITIYYEQTAKRGKDQKRLWRIWCDDMSMIQRNAVFRRLTDLADIVEVKRHNDQSE